MQLERIGTKYGYCLTEEKFQTALAFLSRSDLADLPTGLIELEHGVRASVQHYTTMPKDELYYETHDRYFDIQYLIDGVEMVECVAREGLAVKTPYNAANDVTLYHDPEIQGSVLLHAGEYLVLSPDEAHKPRCAAGKSMPVKKIVVKVPV